MYIYTPANCFFLGGLEGWGREGRGEGYICPFVPLFVHGALLLYVCVCVCVYGGLEEGGEGRGRCGNLFFCLKASYSSKIYILLSKKGLIN